MPVSDSSWLRTLGDGGASVCDFEDPLPKLTSKSKGPVQVFFVHDATEVTKAWNAASHCTHIGFDDLADWHQPTEYQRPLKVINALTDLH